MKAQSFVFLAAVAGILTGPMEIAGLRAQVIGPYRPLLEGDVSASQIIVYTAAVTNSLPNIHFVVKEVLKGSYEASRHGITNGVQIPTPSEAGAYHLLTNASGMLIPVSAEAFTNLPLISTNGMLRGMLRTRERTSYPGGVSYITNWTAEQGRAPDGAVILYESWTREPPESLWWLCHAYIVRSGRIEESDWFQSPTDMTIQQFKTKFGL